MLWIFPAEAGELSYLQLEGVSRSDTAHEDPTISTLLNMLEADIRAGRNINAVPQDLAKTMLANAGHGRGLDEDIEGEVEL